MRLCVGTDWQSEASFGCRLSWRRNGARRRAGAGPISPLDVERTSHRRQCRARETCSLHLDAIAARAGVTLQKVDHKPCISSDSNDRAAAAGALSGMVGERLTREPDAAPNPVQDGEKPGADRRGPEVPRRHQGPNRSQRRKEHLGVRPGALHRFPLVTCRSRPDQFTP
jgi:hypothetical protein